MKDQKKRERYGGSLVSPRVSDTNFSREIMATEEYEEKALMRTAVRIRMFKSTRRVDLAHTCCDQSR